MMEPLSFEDTRCYLVKTHYPFTELFLSAGTNLKAAIALIKLLSWLNNGI